jgi:hypothetical protein
MKGEGESSKKGSKPAFYGLVGVASNRRFYLYSGSGHGIFKAAMKAGLVDETPESL